MLNNNRINSTNGKQYEIYLEDGRFEIREIVTDAQVFAYAVVYAIISCYLIPSWIPYMVLWGVLLSSLYAMACIYENNK